jgi:hypothetical protein
MNYLELADLLNTVGRKTARHHEQLEGLPLAKAADNLVRAAEKYEKKLEDFLGGRGPGIQELEELLKSPQARGHLKLPALRLLFKELFQELPVADKLAEARKQFFERVKREQAGEKTLETLKRFFLQAAQRPAPAKDETSLQNEFLRLGSLSDEELEFEFSGRLKSIALLKALAKANAIPFSRETSKNRLIELITHYARRAHANVRHRA